MWNAATVQQLLISVFGLVLVIVGISVAGSAKRAQYHETARVGFNTVVSIVIAAMGAGAIAIGVFGPKILALLGVTGLK